MNSRQHGEAGERVAAELLGYEGWEILERQALVHGHAVDFRAKHPKHGEALIEVKVWATKSGRDNAKKAIGVAWDLLACGEQTPYILILSHELTGILGDMLARAVTGGAISQIRVVELRDWTPSVRP